MQPTYMIEVQMAQKQIYWLIFFGVFSKFCQTKPRIKNNIGIFGVYKRANGITSRAIKPSVCAKENNFHRQTKYINYRLKKTRAIFNKNNSFIL